MILLAMSLGVFIAQLDSQVVNLALRHIGGELGADVNALQWVMDSYNLLYATLLLTGGTLGDLYGRTRVFIAGVGLIVAGSLICALAPNVFILIGGRALTGIGAALDVPTSLSILTVAIPDQKARAHALGIWASCNGIAIGLGPTVGGLLVDGAGWRSIFALVVPLCLLTMALAYWRVPDSHDRDGRRLDLAGQGLAIAVLASLAFVTIEGPHLGWRSPVVLLLGIVCIVGAIAFVRVENGRPGAMVPLDLFRSGQFNAALAAAGTMTFGMYAMLFLTPLYLQTFGGYSAFSVGLQLLPLSLVFIAVSQSIGWLGRRFGMRVLMTAGLGCMGSGLLMLTLVSAQPNLFLIQPALVIIGLGLGLNTAPVNAVAVASLPANRSGTASGLVNTARMIGATLGIAVLGAIYAVASSSGSSEHAIAGLRLAYFGGAVVEFTGALIALRFIPGDATQRTRPFESRLK